MGTCGEPNEIKKNTHPKNAPAHDREQATAASGEALSIKVPTAGVQRLSFMFNNTDSNIQLLLPMTITISCTGGPCTGAPPAPPAPPGPNATVVACVGDSITQGYLSSNGADYPHQLQRMLGPAYRVISFGAVQFHPHGGQFDFVWRTTRTLHGAYVWRA